MSEATNGRCARFLRVSYEALEARVREGGSDDELLEWCFQCGRRPSNEDIQIWNAFMAKRGWRDDASESLEEAKHAAGLGRREDIQTYFDLLQAAGTLEPQMNAR